MSFSLSRMVIVPRALIIVDAVGGYRTTATELRAAAREATSTLVEGDSPEPIAIVTGAAQGSDEADGRAGRASSTPGSFKPFGVECAVAAGTELAELLGRWLVEDALRARSLKPSEASCVCFESVGQALAAGYRRLLVPVDGAFGLGADSPIGNVDQAFVTDALCRQIAGGDCTSVSLADAVFPAPGDYAAELWVQLAEAVTGGARGDGGCVEKHVHFSGAPYGIGYHVASWRREENRLEREERSA